MSEENNNLGDDLKDGLDNAADTVKDTAENIADGAKEAANDFKEGWNQATGGGENKKMMAGILAILIGSLGIHKFVLGYTKEGIIQIVVTFITCGAGGIIGLIEGIIYLTKSDEEFYNTYQVGKKPWF
jgi:TM2 domain-containing membrane protein YozV